MKIAQLFRAYLEKHNYLQLPQIGRFEVVNENSNSAENESNRKWVRFLADKNQDADNQLIDFISKTLKVEVCVTESDLKSFISSAKELLIQGFEIEIPGIGYLHFEPGNILKFSGKNLYKKPVNKGWRKMPLAFSSSFWF